VGSIQLLFILALIAICTGLLLKYVKMEPPHKTIILVCSCVIMVLIAMKAFGVWEYIDRHDPAIPRIDSR